MIRYPNGLETGLYRTNRVLRGRHALKRYRAKVSPLLTQPLGIPPIKLGFHLRSDEIDERLRREIGFGNGLVSIGHASHIVVRPRGRA